MKHLNVVGAAIFRGGNVLAAKRGESRFAYVAHKYEFAGGKIEEGESGEAAIVRELFEELGVKARVLGVFGRTSYEYPDFSLTLTVYECEAEGEIVCREHESLSWLSRDLLKEEEWAPADAPFLPLLRERLREKSEK